MWAGMSCGRLCAAVSVMAVPAHAQPTSSADEPPPFQLLRYADAPRSAASP